MLSTLRTRLAAPVDGASTALFRVAVGAALCWEVIRYGLGDRIRVEYVEPGLHFSYWPFTFVRTWPEPWMSVHFAVVGLLGLCVCFGMATRLSSMLLLFGFSWLFLVDQALYLNHLYFCCLLLTLLAVVPCAGPPSFDAWWRGRNTETVPTWVVLLLRLQVGVPYFWGGIAKLNPDWLLHAEPMRAWLRARRDLPILGPAFGHEPVILFFNYGGLLVDLIAPFLLLIPRTRVLGFTLILMFNLLNSRIFSIGIFPWVMLATGLIYFPPDWPRQVWADVRAGRAAGRRFVLGAATGALLGAALPRWLDGMHVTIAAVAVGLLAHQLWHDRERTGTVGLAGPLSPRIGLLLLAWWAVQTWLPLRHFLVPGQVMWTEEGHKYAWHMKQRDKDGRLRMSELDLQTHARRRIDLASLLTPDQRNKAAGRPELVVQLAHILRHQAEAEGRQVAIFAQTRVSLNGRAPVPLIDPTVDLSRVPLGGWMHAPWLLPSPATPPGRPLSRPAPRATTPE
jgi:vitamin K-dependent gamma-carboxylase